VHLTPTERRHKNVLAALESGPQPTVGLRVSLLGAGKVGWEWAVFRKEIARLRRGCRLAYQPTPGPNGGTWSITPSGRARLAELRRLEQHRPEQP
jgi:hypothetical protein